MLFYTTLQELRTLRYTNKRVLLSVYMIGIKHHKYQFRMGYLNKIQNVLWQSTDGIGLEYLELSDQDNEINVESVLICVLDRKPAKITYQIYCDNKWQFKKLNLMVDTGIKQTLSLEITSEGQWLNESGRVLDELQGCLEPDILLTGFTNTLPVRRLNFKKGQIVEIKVAYISIPQLSIVPVRQRYTCLEQSPDEILFHYENQDSGFETDIYFDQNFLVKDYPGLFRKIVI